MFIHLGTRAHDSAASKDILIEATGRHVLIEIGRCELMAHYVSRAWSTQWWTIEPVAYGRMLWLGRLRLFACRAPKPQLPEYDDVGGERPADPSIGPQTIRRERTGRLLYEEPPPQGDRGVSGVLARR